MFGAHNIMTSERWAEIKSDNRSGEGTSVRKRLQQEPRPALELGRLFLSLFFFSFDRLHVCNVEAARRALVLHDLGEPTSFI